LLCSWDAIARTQLHGACAPPPASPSRRAQSLLRPDRDRHGGRDRGDGKL